MNKKTFCLILYFCFVGFVCFFSFLGLFKLIIQSQNVVNTKEYYCATSSDYNEKEVMYVDYDSDIINLIANMKMLYNKYIEEYKEKPEKVVFCLEDNTTYTMYYSDISKYIE